MRADQFEQPPRKSFDNVIDIPQDTMNLKTNPRSRYHMQKALVAQHYAEVGAKRIIESSQTTVKPTEDSDLFENVRDFGGVERPKIGSKDAELLAETILAVDSYVFEGDDHRHDYGYAKNLGTIVDLLTHIGPEKYSVPTMTLEGRLALVTQIIKQQGNTSMVRSRCPSWVVSLEHLLDKKANELAVKVANKAAFRAKKADDDAKKAEAKARRTTLKG